MQLEAVITASAPAPVGPYNQAVKAGGVLYCSGQIALDPATGLMVGDGDVEAETRQVLSNLKAVLKAGGSSPGQVLRTTVFLADLGDFARVNAIYADLFSDGVSPARACVEVAALPKGARVEIDCIALVSEESAARNEWVEITDAGPRGNPSVQRLGRLRR